MAITGNKGEWSEVYAFLRLLADGKLFAADEQLNRLGNTFFPIIKILREDVAGSKYGYCPTSDTSEVRIFLNDEQILSLPAEKFDDEAKCLFGDISKHGAGKGSFEIPKTEAFIHSIYVNKLKAPSIDKSDINILIHDVNTGFEKIVGFSIKSDLGSPPTLLNPGKTTNFVFEVKELFETKIDTINAIDTNQKIIDRINEIGHNGGKLIFEKVDNTTFEDNLIMIDSQMPMIVAEMLKGFYIKRIGTCSRLAEEVINVNPLKHKKEFYIHKIKELLCASALGMKPATVWDGNDEANGGYIIVKRDGDVVAYHIYNRNFFKDYLLRNTQFVQPSTTRYDYCSLYKENGKIFIKLNLQIRFI
jgi:hypothetical protein